VAAASKAAAAAAAAGPSSSPAKINNTNNLLILSLSAFESAAAGFSVERSEKVEDSVVASSGATLSELSKKKNESVFPLFPTTRAAAAAALTAASATLNNNAPPRWGVLNAQRPGRILPLRMVVDAEEEDLNDEVCRVCWQGVRVLNG